MITLLAINPGWGGQKFIGSTSGRLSRLRKMIADSGQDILLMVDGDITRNNIADIAKMDVDIVVTGSAVFDGKAPVENARYMLGALR
jgi:ribulose-phosphate 3-epimerase